MGRGAQWWLHWWQCSCQILLDPWSQHCNEYSSHHCQVCATPWKVVTWQLEKAWAAALWSEKLQCGCSKGKHLKDHWEAFWLLSSIQTWSTLTLGTHPAGCSSEKPPRFGSFGSDRSAWTPRSHCLVQPLSSSQAATQMQVGPRQRGNKLLSALNTKNLDT